MSEDMNEEKAWKSSFTEGGKTYAASLFWQPLLNESNPIAEVKDAASNILEGADLYAIRKGKSSQFGLAASSQGFTRGIPSAAISLVTGLGNVSSFMGVFKVDTGWWYICFRNEVILSDGDTLFVDEKDAKDQFISMLAVPDWDMLFAPAEWGIDETRHDELSSIISKGLSIKLEKISGNNDAVMLGVIVVAVAIMLWYGYSTLQSMFFSAPAAPVIAPVEQVEVPVEVPPEPKPWEDLQNPIDIMKNCFEATKKVVEVVTPGWKIEGVTCNSGGLVTSWKRELGRLTWMEQALNVSGVDFTSRQISQDGNTFMVTVPIGEISTLNSPPEFTGADLVNILNDLNQALDIDIKFGKKSWTSPRGSVYSLTTLETSSNQDPLVWIEFFMKFSGLTITEVKYDINNGTWSYKGEIYEL